MLTIFSYLWIIARWFFAYDAMRQRRFGSAESLPNLPLFSQSLVQSEFFLHIPRLYWLV
jgi:hypothetical protein